MYTRFQLFQLAYFHRVVSDTLLNDLQCDTPGYRGSLDTYTQIGKFGEGKSWQCVYFNAYLFHRRSAESCEREYEKRYGIGTCTQGTEEQVLYWKLTESKEFEKWLGESERTVGLEPTKFVKAPQSLVIGELIELGKLLENADE